MKFRIGERRMNSTSSFKDILPDIIREGNLEKSFTMEGLITQWYTIVGDIISTHSKPERIYNNTLYIAVDHSVYANELILMKDILLQKIQSEFPYHAIRDIRVDIMSIRW